MTPEDRAKQKANELWTHHIQDKTPFEGVEAIAAALRPSEAEREFHKEAQLIAAFVEACQKRAWANPRFELCLAAEAWPDTRKFYAALAALRKEMGL